MSATMEWDEQTIREIERRLSEVPIAVREKVVKTAFKEGAEIFTRKVLQNVDTLHSAGRDRWNREKDLPEALKQNMRTKTETRTRNQASVIVSIQEKVPMLNAYAAAVEYGHEMWIPVKQPGGKWEAKKMDGRTVPEYPFWRPAKTSVENPIQALVIRAAGRAIKEIVYGK